MPRDRVAETADGRSLTGGHRRERKRESERDDHDRRSHRLALSSVVCGGQLLVLLGPRHDRLSGVAETLANKSRLGRILGVTGDEQIVLGVFRKLLDAGCWTSQDDDRLGVDGSCELTEDEKAALNRWIDQAA
jgi:hypothetical protein